MLLRHLLFLLLFITAALHSGEARIKVACVGDSITAGSGYPAEVEKILGAGYEVKNCGKGGANLLKAGDRPYWKNPGFTAVDTFAPDLVVIQLGTNDTKDYNFKLKDQFVHDYTDLVDHFAALPSKPKIFLCLPVPIFGNGFRGLNEANLAVYLPMIRQVAEAKKTGLIDLHTALTGKDEMFKKDNVHPDAAAAKIMAETVAAAIAAAVKKP